MASTTEPPQTNTAQANPKSSDQPSKPRPFPAITGSCVCTTIRYRLLTAPLFCYACHCRDCQKTTGSAFGLYLNIEAHYIHILSPRRPSIVVRPSKSSLLSRAHAAAVPASSDTGSSGTVIPSSGATHHCFECPLCKTELWTRGLWGEGVCDVRVGTLDFPSLMEPDVHSYVESKMEWVRLPEGARAVQKGFRKDLWPKSSLKRLEICKKRVAEAKAAAKAAAKAKGEEEGGGEGEGEKTPTAVEFGAEEDDEAFEKRFRETERALQERLERLTIKLEEEKEGKEVNGASEKEEVSKEGSTK